MPSRSMATTSASSNACFTGDSAAAEEKSRSALIDSAQRPIAVELVFQQPVAARRRTVGESGELRFDDLRHLDLALAVDVFEIDRRRCGAAACFFNDVLFFIGRRRAAGRALGWIVEHAFRPELGDPGRATGFGLVIVLFYQ